MPRCWSYSPDGEHRCELDAGHEEDHTTYRIWKDEDSYQPDAPITFPIVGAPAPPVTDTSPPPLPDPMPTPAGCVACGHKHANGECRCGCYEQIG